jgi:hypothetical protein
MHDLQELQQTSTAAAMRLLWSYMHDAAVQQHGAGAWSAGKPASGGSKRGRKPGKAAAAAAAAAEAAADASKQHKQTAGAKRKASATISEAAAGKKAKANSGGAAAGSGKQQRKQADADEEAAAAAGSKPSKKRKQAKSSAAAAGDGKGDASLVVIEPPLSADDPQLQDEQLMKYGAPIAGEGWEDTVTRVYVYMMQILQQVSHGYFRLPSPTCSQQSGSRRPMDVV